MRRLLHSALARYPLTIVLLATIVCWLPYFAASIVPFHDSAYVYQNFHCFYRELFFQHDLVRWFPYANYGLPADFGQNALYPTAYITIAAGLLAGVRDTLLLNKAALLLNELLFACGLLRLTGELYSQRFTRLLITLGGVLSVSWLQQSMLNLSVVYLLPLVMFYLARFFRTGRVAALYWAGLIEVCSIIGSVAYFAPLQGLVLCIFAVGLACEYWPVLCPPISPDVGEPKQSATASPPAIGARLRHSLVHGPLAPRRMLHPLLIVILAVAAVIVCFLGGSFSDLMVLAPGRDPVTGNTTLETFLNYGRPPVATTVVGFLAGVIPHGDNTYYIGLLPLVMLGYALVRERSKVFLALAAGALSLCWLSLGGTFAKGVYHWPGMHMFRHVGLVFSIGALFMLLAGGYGLDRFVRRCRGLSIAPAPQLTRRLVLLLIVGGLVLADLQHCWRPFDLDLRFVHGAAWPFAAFRGVLYLAAGLAIVAGCLSHFKSLLAAALPGFAAVVFLLDMGSFRAEVFATIERVSTAGQTAGVFAADRLPYRSERSAEAADELARARLEVFTRPLQFVHNGHNASASSMIALDSCRPQFRGDFICQGVCELLRRRGGVPSPYPTDAYLPANDASLQKVLGCGVPKLRLTRQVKIARSEEQAAAWFAASPDLYATTILQADDPGVSDSSEDIVGHPCGTIEVEDFSSNTLAAQVCVSGREPAWLVYADAWHPGWTALVDGARVAVSRANLGLKAVQVPCGTHRVEFVYAPRLRNALAWSFAFLGLSAGAGLLVEAAASVLAEIRRRPKPSSPREVPSPSWAARPARKSALRV